MLWQNASACEQAWRSSRIGEGLVWYVSVVQDFIYRSYLIAWSSSVMCALPNLPLLSAFMLHDCPKWTKLNIGIVWLHNTFLCFITHSDAWTFRSYSTPINPGSHRQNLPRDYSCHAQLIAVYMWSPMMMICVDKHWVIRWHMGACWSQSSLQAYTILRHLPFLTVLPTCCTYHYAPMVLPMGMSKARICVYVFFVNCCTRLHALLAKWWSEVHSVHVWEVTMTGQWSKLIHSSLFCCLLSWLPFPHSLCLLHKSAFIVNIIFI